MPEIILTDIFTDEEAAATAISADSYIFYSASSTYMDDDGFYMAPEFGLTPLVSGSDATETMLDNLSSGEVGIFWEGFNEELYSNYVRQYYTLSDSDPPSGSYDTSTLKMSFTYDTSEELALGYRFGSSKSSTQIIDSAIKDIATQVATTNVNAEHTFKKIRYEVLDYDNLSSFEDEEATQNITVATSFASGSDSSMGSSY